MVQFFKGDPLFAHKKCPHPSVHRISNDPDEGCTNAGRSGWHMDGVFVEAPFSYAIYHMLSVPKKGATEFVGFKELLDSIPNDKREKWDRLWMVNDKGDKLVQPLVYLHPVTKLPDKGTPNERRTDEEETKEIIEEITNEIEKNGKELVYTFEWEEGEFIITDNLAVVHFASADSQRPRSEVGLRVLHRTTIKGTSKPSKTEKI